MYFDIFLIHLICFREKELRNFIKPALFLSVYLVYYSNIYIRKCSNVITNISYQEKKCKNFPNAFKFGIKHIFQMLYNIYFLKVCFAQNN